MLKSIIGHNIFHHGRSKVNNWRGSHTVETKEISNVKHVQMNIEHPPPQLSIFVPRAFNQTPYITATVLWTNSAHDRNALKVAEKKIRQITYNNTTDNLFQHRLQVHFSLQRNLKRWTKQCYCKSSSKLTTTCCVLMGWLT